MSDDDEVRYRFVPVLRDPELFEEAARRVAGGDTGWSSLRSPRGVLFKFDDLEHAQAFRVWVDLSAASTTSPSSESVSR